MNQIQKQMFITTIFVVIIGIVYFNYFNRPKQDQSTDSKPNYQFNDDLSTKCYGILPDGTKTLLDNKDVNDNLNPTATIFHDKARKQKFIEIEFSFETLKSTKYTVYDKAGNVILTLDENNLKDVEKAMIKKTKN